MPSMVKFSANIDDEQTRLKRLRRCSDEEYGEEEYEAEEYGEEEYSEEEEEEKEGGDDVGVGCKKTCDSSSSLTPTILLDDLDILDCPTCYEPLTTPIFQCKNGHISCDYCCVRLHHLCSFCRLATGYIRCRVIEDIIDSSRISCKNFKFGCPQILRCVEKRNHESICEHSPVCCPMKCSSVMYSRKDIAEHLKAKHKIPGTFFEYNVTFSMKHNIVTEKHRLLIERRKGTMFFLHSIRIPTHGNAFSITQFEPLPGNEKFGYKITAISGKHYVKYTSSSVIVQNNICQPPNLMFCLITPFGFFSFTQLKLNVHPITKISP